MMRQMPTVQVTVQPRSYEVRIESGLLTEAGTVLQDFLPLSTRLFVVTVAALRGKWAKKLVHSLKAVGFDVEVLEMPEGERFKRLTSVERLAEKLTLLGADRTAAILAFGGGGAGDVAGFVPSVHTRGLRRIQIP